MLESNMKYWMNFGPDWQMVYMDNDEVQLRDVRGLKLISDNTILRDISTMAFYKCVGGNKVALPSEECETLEQLIS